MPVKISGFVEVEAVVISRYVAASSLFSPSFPPIFLLLAMPHLLDNSYVNLDILPGRKAEDMTDKAQETASEGGNAAG